jgi:hypothetical protein
MKIPTTMKITFIFSFILLFLGVILSNDAIIGTAVVISVVISCTYEILEAIQSKNDEESKQ